MAASIGLRIFISYEAESGTVYAEAAYAILTGGGASAWVWHLHRRSGGYTFDEIAARIEEADYLLVICTDGTRSSRGQQFEINTALGLGKKLWVITPDRAFVPPALAGFNHDVAGIDRVREVCQEWLYQWQRGFPEWPSVRDEVAESTTDESADLGNE